MATRPEFAEYVCDQVRGAGEIRAKKMFGEYMVYVDDKPILLVCDDTVFVKMRPELSEIMENAERGCPYDGAKEHYILDIDDADLSREVIGILEPLTLRPKPRKPKRRNPSAR
ncbi:MAG: TfoX/Sxy family protein [Candidatus Adiutrix sp.]|jgi:TfoX/Sxy family transcriptional regulator of competence genes|nr:TfoX/Sxy family protein [Candidatus Adiutrix sp.]